MANGGRRVPWRVIGWGGAVALLLVPFVAMQFTREVNWTAGDFVAAAILLAVPGLAFEFAARRGGWTYRAASGVALLGAFLMTWINLAVGIIGDEGNDANWMFVGIVLAGIVGAVAARFRPRGMALTLLAMAGLQLLVGTIAVIGDLGAGGPVWPREIIGVTAVFTGVWLLSAWLFRRAAR